MNELFWMIFGIASALIVLLLAYPGQIYIKMKINKNKIKNTLVQIRGQIEIKHDLLKEYLEINKDSIDGNIYEAVTNKLCSYNYKNEWDIEILKDFNNYYLHQLKSFDDNLLSRHCDESETKIACIKDYYNELVYGFNNYKSNGFNYFVAKAMSIEDEKLY